MWNLPRPGTEPVSPALAGEFLPTAPPGKFWRWPTFHKPIGQLDTLFWDMPFFCLFFILDWLSFSCWFGGILYVFLIWVLHCIMHYKYFLPFYGLSVFYLDSEKQMLFILLRIKFPNNFLRLLWLVLFCVSLKKSLPSIKSRKYSPMCLLKALSLYFHIISVICFK